MKNKGMKLLSKIVAACFALILTISMAIPAQAKIAEDEKHTITVTGKKTDANAMVDIYKIVDVRFDYEKQQPVKPTYVWVDPVAEWLKHQKGCENYIENGNEVPKSFQDVRGEELGRLMNELKKAIVNGDLQQLDTVASGIIKSNNYQIVFDKMDMGQYLILTTANTKGEFRNYEYAPVTANIVPVYDEEKEEWFAYDAAVTIKGSPAEIEKDVNDHTVQVGQTVEYTVNVPVPYYPEDATAKLFRIGDQLPIGITFGKTYEENKLMVGAVYENGEKQLIGKATTTPDRLQCFTYYYQATDCGKDGVFSQEDNKVGRNATFILDFNYDALMEQYGTYTNPKGETFALKAIEVRYQGIINENAILRPGDPEYPEDADPLENKAYVGQNNNPYDWDTYEPTEDKEKVYTYAIEVTKVTEDGKTLLPGAEFQLLKDDKKTPIEFTQLSADGHYVLAKEGDSSVTTTLVVGETEGNVGKLKLEGLTTGTYYLKETKSPDGYEVLDELIEVQIIDEDENGQVDNAGDKVDKSANTNIVYKTVVNRKPPIMPITGGMGTVIFSVVGIVLVVGGVTLIASYLRRKRA